MIGTIPRKTQHRWGPFPNVSILFFYFARKAPSYYCTHFYDFCTNTIWPLVGIPQFRRDANTRSGSPLKRRSQGAVICCRNGKIASHVCFLLQNNLPRGYRRRCRKVIFLRPFCCACISRFAQLRGFLKKAGQRESQSPGCNSFHP